MVVTAIALRPAKSIWFANENPLVPPGLFSRRAIRRTADPLLWREYEALSNSPKGSSSDPKSLARRSRFDDCIAHIDANFCQLMHSGPLRATGRLRSALVPRTAIPRDVWNKSPRLDWGGSTIELSQRDRDSFYQVLVFHVKPILSHSASSTAIESRAARAKKHSPVAVAEALKTKHWASKKPHLRYKVIAERIRSAIPFFISDDALTKAVERHFSKLRRSRRVRNV